MAEINSWHILGVGAIGSLFAAKLTEAGMNCRLLLRDPESNSNSGYRTLQVEDEAGTHHYKLAVARDADAPIEQLLVTTKAYDVRTALQSVSHRLASEARVVIMTNGMGLLETASSVLCNAQVFAGTTTEGAYRTGINSIRHAGTGITRVGYPGSTEEASWFDDWRSMGLDCHWENDIQTALWHKLAINCAINPLTALHRCSNGKLDSSPTLRSVVVNLCDEIAAVSEAAGFPGTAKTIHRESVAVIRQTARNKSSMLQDVLANRRTEIDFITGYLVERACALGVPVARNQELLERISNLDC